MPLPSMSWSRKTIGKHIQPQKSSMPEWENHNMCQCCARVAQLEESTHQLTGAGNMFAEHVFSSPEPPHGDRIEVDYDMFA